MQRWPQHTLQILILFGLLLAPHQVMSDQNPDQALKTFQIAPGYKVELFATQPHVAYPTAMAFDENANCYVAEMSDPWTRSLTGHRPRGRITLLSTPNQKGAVTRSSIFAENLS